MYVRAYESKGHTYLAIVESLWENGRSVQKTVRYLGRKDRLQMDEVYGQLQGLRDGMGRKVAAIPKGSR